jgi:NACalpha-BTF3-like transcription factor
MGFTVIPGTRGAPITALLLGSSAALGLLIEAGGVRALRSFAFLPPFGAFPGMNVALCAGAVVYHARAWERRKGSGRFLLLCLWPVLALCLVARIFSAVGGSLATPGAQLWAEAFMGGTGGWVALCCALLVRILIDIPPPRVGFSTFSDKWIISIAVAKLTIVDAFFSSARGQSTASVTLVAAAVGTLVGLAMAKNVLGSTKLLTLLDGNAIFEAGLKPVQELLTGGRGFVTHARPQPADDENADADVQAAIAASMMAGGHGQQHPAAAAAAAGQRRLPPGAAPPRPAAAAAGAGGAVPAPSATRPGPVSPGDVDLLTNLLSCSRDEAMQALARARGDVDLAASFLMDRTR